jgi:hypothetical protein
VKAPARAAPILLAVLSLGATVEVLVRACRHDGVFVLPIDDAYIHLAVAKHLAANGVWGVTSAGFTASVTSIGWSLLIAAIFKVTGASIAVPIVLNVLGAAAILLVADAAMRRFHVATPWRAGVLQAIVFCTPLPLLVVLGMEHVLQTLVALAFVFQVCRTIVAPERSARAAAVGGGLAMLATVIRYDAVLVVAVAVGALLVARRGRAALWIAAGGLLPLLAFGIVSRAHGWPAVPTSVLVRLPLVSEPRTPLRAVVHFLGYRGLRTLAHEPALATLLMAAVLVAALRRSGRARAWDERQWLLTIFAATLALHVQFARTGWFLRYEAYLVALGLVAIAVAAAELFARAPRARTIVLATAVVFTPLGVRGVQAVQHVPAWSLEQFASRHQAARFLGRFYDEAVVETGDIGEVCYATDIRLIDVNGLGSLELLPSILATAENSPAPEAERLAARNADVIVTNLPGGPPVGWQLAGCWTTADDRICEDTYYQFYARRGADALRLTSALQTFGDPVHGLALVVAMDGNRADGGEEQGSGGRGEPHFPDALHQRSGDAGRGARANPVHR